MAADLPARVPALDGQAWPVDWAGFNRWTARLTAARASLDGGPVALRLAAGPRPVGWLRLAGLDRLGDPASVADLLGDLRAAILGPLVDRLGRLGLWDLASRAATEPGRCVACGGSGGGPAGPGQPDAPSCRPCAGTGDDPATRRQAEEAEAHARADRLARDALGDS